MIGRSESARAKGPSMATITIGLDLAKSVFQVHGVDVQGNVTIRRQLRRSDMHKFFAKLPPCLIGMEACGTSHYWARELTKLGHTVKQMPAEYVKAYRKRSKTDPADAEAICEAVTRPRIPEVPTKTVAQQTATMPHKARDQFVGMRTALSNMIRSLMAEFGIIAAAGEKGVETLLAIVVDETRNELSAAQRAPLMAAAASLAEINASIDRVDAMILAHAKSCDMAKRLKTLPGVGAHMASAFAATVTAPTAFPSGRAFAASLGLTPKISGTGGEVMLGSITKRGNGYLRRMLYLGAAARLSYAARCPDKADPALVAVLPRMPFRKAAIRLANKMARVIWALMVRGGTYIEKHLPTVRAATA